MFDFNSICKGYDDEQYAKALYITLATYLDRVGIINGEDLIKFQEENFSTTLKEIIENDKVKAKEAYEEYMNKYIEKKKGE